MLKDITLGQFFPGRSPVHLLDPRTKLILLVVYIVALFLAVSWVSYAVMFLFLVMVIAVSKVPVKSVLSGMKPLVFILIFTGILNLFFTKGEQKLVEFWIITIYWEGLRQAIFMVIRILLLITGTFMLTYTTSPISLTDGLESLLGPLKKLRLPIHELSMMMCIALRFIPTLTEETEMVVSCVSKANGKETRLTCQHGCIGCRLCIRTCVKGAVTVVDFHANLDPDLCDGCAKCAENCPVGCITVLNGKVVIDPETYFL